MPLVETLARPATRAADGSGPTVMVVDDEPSIVQVIQAYLERDGYRVVTANDGIKAMEAFHRTRPDLIILDLMLPGLSGTDVCINVRKQSQTPIIILTARSDETDKIVGLKLGADDYVTKPFSPGELAARVEAVLRRVRGGSSECDVVAFGDLVIDYPAFSARLDGREVDLTPTEFKLLEVLSRRPGKVFSRLELVDRVHGFAYEGYERTIDTHIKNLRKKLGDDAAEPRFIRTVYGVGYKFERPAR